MKACLQLLTGALILAYPIAVYFGLNYLPVGSIALVLCVLLTLRLALQQNGPKPMLLPLLCGIALTAGSFLSQQANLLLYYPVLINLAMLSLFSWSLRQEQSMIERLARLREPDLPDSATGYLRRITLLWCGLFLVNGSIAAYTAAYTSLATWTLYNGFISYLLMGLLLAGEWLYRHLRLNKA
jgi:uncharacterized membrane protein